MIVFSSLTPLDTHSLEKVSRESKASEWLTYLARKRKRNNVVLQSSSLWIKTMKTHKLIPLSSVCLRCWRYLSVCDHEILLYSLPSFKYTGVAIRKNCGQLWSVPDMFVCLFDIVRRSRRTIECCTHSALHRELLPTSGAERRLCILLSGRFPFVLLLQQGSDMKQTESTRYRSALCQKMTEDYRRYRVAAQLQ